MRPAGNCHQLISFFKKLVGEITGGERVVVEKPSGEKTGDENT